MLYWFFLKLAGFNGHISTLGLLLLPVPRKRPGSIAAQHNSSSSGPTPGEFMCYIGGQSSETSIVPATTKPDMKRSPQTSDLLPLHPPLTSMGEGKMGGLRGRKKLQLGHKGWQEEPHNCSLPLPPTSAGRAPGPELCSLLVYSTCMCQLEGTYTS